MHAGEWACLAVGLIVGYQTGGRTILGRLGRAERRSRSSSIRGR